MPASTDTHTDRNKNLIKLFYLQESFKKYTGLEKSDIKPKDVVGVGVLGAGLMGGGIAWLMTNKSIKVRLKDIEWDFISKAYQTCADIYNKRVKRRRMKPYERDLKMQLISSTKDYRGFSELDLIIEAVPEDMDLKKSIFKELEGVCREDAILATHTSALSVTDMASGLKNPERFVGMHFFSPVHRMPLVEVICGEETSDQTVTTIVALAKRCGKTPVVVKNCPGF